MPSKEVFLSLGSNLGDRQANLGRALVALAGENVEVLARSSIYETEPQDVADQPWFLNIVVSCRTQHFPMQLLAVLNKVERALGRTRTGAPPRGPRVIDIDILLYGRTVVNTDVLTVPHARMFERRFVLEPLLEIVPELKHPFTGRPLRETLARLRGQAIRKSDRVAGGTPR